MKKTTPALSYEVAPLEPGRTQFAFAFEAIEKAERAGVFRALDRHLSLSMKRYDYSVIDKLKTLWLSIVIGCDHTKEINTRLGTIEPDLAARLGLRRFPDQSGINRLLTRLDSTSIDEVRAAHFQILTANTRARDRSRWLRLPGGRRLLVVDFDQRALVVRGKKYELAEKGFFGRKRGRRGYQLSLAYLGGAVGEVLDEHLDPGSTHAGARVETMLEATARFVQALGLRPDEVLIRADAQYGTPVIVKMIEARGFHYLIKGISPQRARVLSRAVGEQAVFDLAGHPEGTERRWMTDLGLVAHAAAGRRQEAVTIEARTLFGVWVHEVPSSGTPLNAATRARRRAAGTLTRRQVAPEYWLTSLEAEDLPAPAAVEIYNERVTIESYFRDEQQALGARHVRTKSHGGEAVFEWLVALANNVLKWMREATFAGTVVETLGLKRLVKEVLSLPAAVQRTADSIIVRLPSQTGIIRLLSASWKPLLSLHESSQNQQLSRDRRGTSGP